MSWSTTMFRRTRESLKEFLRKDPDININISDKAIKEIGRRLTLLKRNGRLQSHNDNRGTPEMCVKSEQQTQYENQDEIPEIPKIPWSETVFGRLEALELDTKSIKADIERFMLILTCDRDDEGNIKLHDCWNKLSESINELKDDVEKSDTSIAKAFDNAKKEN